MGKNIIDYALPAALGALAVWQPWAAPAAEAAAGGTAAAGAAGAANAAGAAQTAGLLGNAFGSADMIAKGAAGGMGLLNGGAAAAAMPGTIESAGVDFINGVPQNFGARVEGFFNDLGSNNMMRMGMPQQQPQQQRPAAITNQVKPVGRNAQPSEPTEMPYSQSSLTQDPINAQQNLTPEKIWQLQMLRAMGRI